MSSPLPPILPQEFVDERAFHNLFLTCGTRYNIRYAFDLACCLAPEW
jgi:hypothetical protein